MNKVLWFTAGVAAACYLCGPIVDPDLWWHITVGRWMLSHRELPGVDHWNMFALGTPWRAYSWAPELLFAAVEQAFGMHGLLVLKLILAGVLTLSLMYCLGELAGDHFMGALLGIYCSAATFNHFTLRPQSLVWIYFVWLIFTAWRVSQHGLSRARGAALVLIMLAWANTHLTAVLGLLGAAVWSGPQRRTRRGIAYVIGLCLLGTLMTPYLGGEWLTMFRKSLHPFNYKAIAEFGPATVLQHSTGFLLLLGVVLLAFLHRRPAAVEQGKLLFCLLLSVAGLAVVKFLPFAVIALGAALAQVWGHERGEPAALGNIAEAFRRLQGLSEKLAGPGLAFVFVCVAIVNVHNVWQAPVGTEVVPVAAVDFIQEKGLPHPILNSFGRGGYMMYRFSDRAGNLQHPVPIDGRTNVTPPKVWEHFLASYEGKQSWRRFIELVRPRTILWETLSPLTTILIVSGEWCRVFESGDEKGGFAVFVEKEEYYQRFRSLASDNCGVEP